MEFGPLLVCPTFAGFKGASLQHSCVQTCSRKSFPCHSYEQPRNTFKTRGFKSIPCHSYRECPYKSFACHSYEKHRGGHQLFPKRNPLPRLPKLRDASGSLLATEHCHGSQHTDPRVASRGPNFDFRISTLSQLWTINYRLSTSLLFPFSIFR